MVVVALGQEAEARRLGLVELVEYFLEVMLEALERLVELKLALQALPGQRQDPTLVSPQL